MSSQLDQVRAELAAIHDELLSIPGDDYARRVELQDRRNHLRALSAELTEPLPGPARQTLLADFERLHRARDHILELTLGPVSESIGDAGLSYALTTAINDAIAQGMGIDEIEKQIRTVLGQLRAR